MTTLHAFGDSFTVGDLDDFLEETKPPHSHSMAYNERIKYLKENVSYASLVAKHFGFTYYNHAVRGSGNFPQLDKICLQISKGMIKAGDIVIFGLSSFSRDRISIADHKRVSSLSFGPCMIDKDLYHNHELEDVIGLDLFYVLSTLRTIKLHHDLKLICLQMFDLPYLLPNYNFDFYIGHGRSGTTIIDYLTDSWGIGLDVKDHTKFVIPQNFKHLFTDNGHPSVDGHKKIADWIIRDLL